MYHDAIVKVQEMIQHCQNQKLKECEIVVTLLGIQARLNLDVDLPEMMALLEQIEQQSNLLNLKR